MREFLAITRALSDDSRVRVLMFLADGELCVCEIIEMLGLAPSTVSKHMAILHQARLVDSRKDGRWTYYRLADKDPPSSAREAVAWARNCLANAPQVRQDAKRLGSVRRMDRDKLSSCYKS